MKMQVFFWRCIELILRSHSFISRRKSGSTRLEGNRINPVLGDDVEEGWFELDLPFWAWCCSQSTNRNEFYSCDSLECISLGLDQRIENTSKVIGKIEGFEPDYQVIVGNHRGTLFQFPRV